MVCKAGVCIGRDVSGRVCMRVCVCVCVDVWRWTRRSKAHLLPRGIKQQTSTTAVVELLVVVVVVRMLISSGSPAEAMDGRKASRL